MCTGFLPPQIVQYSQRIFGLNLYEVEFIETNWGMGSKDFDHQFFLLQYVEK